jgi:hypothetical protein
VALDEVETSNQPRLADVLRPLSRDASGRATPLPRKDE